MSLSNKLRRLASMGPSEIASRVGQGLAKRLDGLGLFLPKSDSFPVDRQEDAGKFFFSESDIPGRVKLIREYIPAFEARVIEQAEQILRNQFSLLGYGPLDYGPDVDWQRDAVSGVSAPLEAWPRLDHQDYGTVGDSKVTWELNRHQFLVTLAKAWLLTGDDRFVKKLENAYYDWQAKNTYPHGINWGSSLEVAFRSLAWLWVRELLAGCASATRLRLDISKALGFNAWYIRRYLSTYFAPNTHLLGEAVALFFIGTLCPGLRHASDWRETGWKIIVAHAHEKVREDGAYYEQSTYYHVYALDFFLHARILAGRNDMAIPAQYDDVLRRMLRHLSSLCQAGPPPRLGDDDGGRVFDPGRNRAEHLCDPLAIGASLFPTSALKQPSVQVTEEMLWLLGEQGLRTFLASPGSDRVESTGFPNTGLYVSRATDGSRSQVVMDAGPLGGGSGGHGHADALSIALSLDGKPLLVDPGACKYFAPDSVRNDFRTTQAHNTIEVDHRSQAEPRTLFSWHRWPDVTVDASVFEPEFDLVSACHDGYGRLDAPVIHRRTVLALPEGFWLVLDDLASEGAHEYTLRWHLAPQAEVKEETVQGWIVELEGSRLHLLTAANGWHCTVAQGWYSPSYGRKESAPVLVAAKSAFGSEAIATLLWPERPTSSAPTAIRLENPLGISAYRVGFGGTESICFLGNGNSEVEIEGWASDARFLYATLGPDGRPQRVIAVQATFVRYRDTTIRQSSMREAHILWQQS